MEQSDQVTESSSNMFRLRRSTEIDNVAPTLATYVRNGQVLLKESSRSSRDDHSYNDVGTNEGRRQGKPPRHTLSQVHHTHNDTGVTKRCSMYATGMLDESSPNETSFHNDDTHDDVVAEQNCGKGIGDHISDNHRPVKQLTTTRTPR